MAYFTAVMAKAGRSWKARDVEVDDAGTLDELVDALRVAAVDGQPVLAVVEHEDEWFGLVRVDAEDEPRLFVSDLGAVAHSPYGEVLGPAADADIQAQAEEAPEGSTGGDEDDGPVIVAWAGEPDLLEDLGVSSRRLRTLVEDNADDPGAVLGEVGEAVGFAELLEALR